MITTNKIPQKPDKPIKVVVLGTFNPNKPTYHPSPDEDQYYLASWGGLWARRVKERYPDLDIEVWRPEPDFVDISYRKAFGIVDCTIFPAKGFIVSKTLTWEMLKKLWQYKKDYHLVFHINTIFDWRSNLMMPILVPGSRIVLSHHGGTFPAWSVRRSRFKKKMLLWSFKKIEVVTYLRMSIAKEILKANPKIQLFFLPMGADFELFKPLDKAVCRKRLGLPQHMVYAIIIGEFSELKGVNHILQVYNELKRDNFSVIFVGGKKTDELYTAVAKSGCPFWEHVNQDLLREILSAADFYLHPIFNFTRVGLDVSLIEAMACNRPVVSTQLGELYFDYSTLGYLISNKDDILSKTKKMIKNYDQFSKCRETAMKHLDGKTSIIDKLYGIYND